MVLRLFFFVGLFFSQNCFSSAPAETAVKLPPLKVQWEKGLNPLKVGWKGRASKKIKGQSSVELARVKYPSQKLELLVQLRGAKKAPLILEIPDEQSSITVTAKQFKPVAPEVLWLIGETPLSRCRSQVSFHLRFLNKKSLYHNFSGLFAVQLKKENVPKNSAFYLQNQLPVDTPEKIQSQAFLAASQREKLKCQRHHGSQCPFVFLLKPESFGSTQQIHFQGHKDTAPTAGRCPV